jgi:integrase
VKLALDGEVRSGVTGQGLVRVPRRRKDEGPEVAPEPLPAARVLDQPLAGFGDMHKPPGFPFAYSSAALPVPGVPPVVQAQVASPGRAGQRRFLGTGGRHGPSSSLVDEHPTPAARDPQPSQRGAAGIRERAGATRDLGALDSTEAAAHSGQDPNLRGRGLPEAEDGREPLVKSVQGQAGERGAKHAPEPSTSVPPQALLFVPRGPANLATIAPELAQARTYATASIAAETRRAYTREWGCFAAWCSSKGLASLPAAGITVAAYLAGLADGSATSRGVARKPAGLELALAAISGAHKTAGLASPRDAPEVKAVRAGIRRTHGTAQRQVDPLLVPELRRAVASLPATLHGLRDRALLLVGWAGSFRRAALVSLDVPDAAFKTEGLELHIRRDKTDQEARGRVLPIPFGSAAEVCPVRSLRAWLDAAGITEGPLFRSVDKGGTVSAERLCDRAVALIAKRVALSIGADPRTFAGHSLRAGFATSAIRAGRHYRDVMRHTGHKDVRVFDRYVRAAGLWQDNAAAGLL